MPQKQLLLIGGGHSHVQVLRRQIMDPIPGVHVTDVVPFAENTPMKRRAPGAAASAPNTVAVRQIGLVRATVSALIPVSSRRRVSTVRWSCGLFFAFMGTPGNRAGGGT